jgi:hypothetical protein
MLARRCSALSSLLGRRAAIHATPLRSLHRLGFTPARLAQHAPSLIAKWPVQASALRGLNSPALARLLSTASATPAAPATASPPTDAGSNARNNDERSNEQDPNRYTSGPVSKWLFAVSGLVFVMILLGGLTRLTRSGLSMVSSKCTVDGRKWHVATSNNAVPSLRVLSTPFTHARNAPVLPCIQVEWKFHGEHWPQNVNEWQATFDQYKKYPEFQK